MKNSVKTIVAKVAKGLVASALVGTASSAMAQVALAPLKADQSHTVLLVAPSDRMLNKDQQQAKAIAKVRDQVMTAFGQVFPAIVSNMGGALSGPQGAKSVIVNTAAEIQKTLASRLSEFDGDLPESAAYITAYILPWKKSQNNYFEENSQLHPLFKVLQFEEHDWTAVNPETKKLIYPTDADFYNKVSKSISEAIEASKGTQFTLVAAALQIRVQKDNVAIRAQMLGAIDPTTREFKKDNDQVSLHTLSVPMEDEKVQSRPVALVTITQAIQGEKALNIPEIQIDLGTFGGINGGHGGWFGQLQTLQNDVDVMNFSKNTTSESQDVSDCKMSVSGLPALIGILGPAPTDKVAINAILKKLKPMHVTFRIKRIKLNATTLRVDDMSVLTQVGKMQALKCLAMKDVSEQVKGEANLAIEDAVKSIYAQDDITDQLMDEMYN